MEIKALVSSINKTYKSLFHYTDEDETLITKNPSKKGRAIVEVDLDGSYVLSEKEVEKSNKVKMFSKFIDDLMKNIQK